MANYYRHKSVIRENSAYVEIRLPNQEELITKVKMIMYKNRYVETTKFMATIHYGHKGIRAISYSQSGRMKSDWFLSLKDIDRHFRQLNFVLRRK